MKGNNFPLKLKKGYEYYNKGDYDRAAPLLADALTFYRGTPDAERIVYYIAYSHYKTQDYTLASYEFKNFYDAYSTSEFSEDAYYYYAYCLYLGAPRSDLDQSNTQTAIDAFQLYLDKYPATKRADDCNKYVDELKAKLEDKVINNALLYYKIQNYKSAVWALRDALNKYPATKERERLEYLIVKSAYLYAENSVEEKKAERYQAAINSYDEFKDRYPGSKYADDAARINAKANEKLGALRKSAVRKPVNG